MKILITGAGRGGTNLVTELIRNINIAQFTQNVEDRSFFQKKILPDNYSTKLATENDGFNIQNITKIMDNNPDLYVIFAIRNPIDNVLSKIIRGQPKSKGGDTTEEIVAPDGTLEGAVSLIKEMYHIYNFLIKNYSNRIITVKMENLILEPEKTTKEICNFFNIEYHSKFLNFYKKNRNQYQKKRYGDKLVKNVNLYLDLDNNFDGYFQNNKDIVEQIKTELKNVINDFNYDEISENS